MRLCLNAIIRDTNDGILVPIPQYPLYSASIQLLGERAGRVTGSQVTAQFTTAAELARQAAASAIVAAEAEAATSGLVWSCCGSACFSRDCVGGGLW